MSFDATLTRFRGTGLKITWIDIPYKHALSNKTYLVTEVKQVAQKYHDAKKDGKISKSEQQAIAKECMDVIVAIGKLVWKF